MINLCTHHGECWRSYADVNSMMFRRGVLRDVGDDNRTTNQKTHVIDGYAVCRTNLQWKSAWRQSKTTNRVTNKNSKIKTLMILRLNGKTRIISLVLH